MTEPAPPQPEPSSPAAPTTPTRPTLRAAKRKSPRPPSRRRRWMLRGLMATVLLLCIPVVLVVHYTRPNNLRPLLEGVLSKQLGGDVTIGKANLSWGGMLTLENLWLDVPGLPKERDEFAKLFETQRLAVQLDYSQLWKGELRVADIEIDRPQLHIIEDLDTGELNLEMLRLAEDKDDKPKPLRLKLPPSIELNAARVRFAQVQGGRFNTLEAMRLEGELRENPQQRRLYDFSLRQYDASARVDATLAGSLDTLAPSLSLTLEGFRIDAAHRQLIPAGFRELWDQLQPTGKLPNLTIHMDANDHGNLRLDEAILELDNVALTPPYDQLGRSPNTPATAGNAADNDLPYTPRMTEVSGRFIVRRDRVRLENLTGYIEGIRYYASGAWGFDDDSPGMIAVSTDPFMLDENPRFLASLPMVGVRMFNRLRPSGQFQASTKFERQPGEPIAVSGVVKLLGARAMYHKFAYPVQNLRGVVTFDRERVRLENITGDGPHGGTVTVRGEISPPADGAAVRIAVEARAIPFDELVMQAFSARRRQGIEQFFDPNMYAALVDERVIRPSPPKVTAEADSTEAKLTEDGYLPPVFDLGGMANVDVLIDRALGDESDYEITATIQAAGLSVLFKDWPYPLVGQSGQIVAGPEGIAVQQVVMQSPTGGRGQLDGFIRQKSKTDPIVPDLRVTDADLPIDDLLLHSIREKEARQIVADLYPAGRLVGTSTITRPDATGDTQWRVFADVVDGVLEPFAGDFRLSAVAGGFELGNDGLDIQQLTGRRGDARLTVNGAFRWGDQPDAFRLDITGQDLQVEHALLDLIPPGETARDTLLALEANHRPAGTVDAHLTWEKQRPAAAERDGEARPPARETYTLVVEPRQFGLDYHGTRLEFSDMGGRLTVRPDTIDLDHVTATFSTGTAEVNGLVGLDGVTPTALTLTAQADAHCPYTRKFLPAQAVVVLDSLAVAGDYRLTDARLLSRPDPKSEQASLEFDAKVNLVDTHLALGVPITGLRGTLEARVRQYPEAPHPVMSFDLRADELRVAERRVAPLTLTLANSAAAPDRLRFDPLMGGVYGGVLVGTGSIPLDAEGRYRFDLTLSDVEADPFLKPALADPTHPDSPTMLAARGRGDVDTAPTMPINSLSFSAMDRDLSTGLLSASLSLESSLQDHADRRGRGAILITDARLVDKPLSTALLRASNLSLPSGAPLKSASARYLVEGDVVRFDELSLSGPSLTIAGAGTMTIPDTALNLIMVSRNAKAPRLGPVSDLFDLFKDELLAIRVTGTLESPETGVTSMRGFQRGWRDLFGTAGATIATDDNLVDE